MALVLLVDDSSFARSMTGRILSRAGHEVMQADNGINALKALMTTPPDCVIADMLMPEMDGQKFLTALRDGNIKIPVIVLTADIQEKTRAACLELGAVEVLHKPPREETLLSAVEKAVGGRG